MLNKIIILSLILITLGCKSIETNDIKNLIITNDLKAIIKLNLKNKGELINYIKFAKKIKL